MTAGRRPGASGGGEVQMENRMKAKGAWEKKESQSRVRHGLGRGRGRGACETAGRGLRTWSGRGGRIGWRRT
jgi:hypothetical protein